MAAYTRRSSKWSQSGSRSNHQSALSSNDDATARVRIFAPSGTQLTTKQAPGTVLGPVKSLVKALDLAGADFPIDGQVVVAGPGQVSAAVQAACIGAAAPLATRVLALSAAGQPLNVRRS